MLRLGRSLQLCVCLPPNHPLPQAAAARISKKVFTNGQNTSNFISCVVRVDHFEDSTVDFVEMFGEGIARQLSCNMGDLEKHLEERDSKTRVDIELFAYVKCGAKSKYIHDGGGGHCT